MGISVEWARHWNTERPLLIEADRVITGRELDRESLDRARSLAGCGVTPGSRVLLSAEPSVDLIVTYVAVLRLGAIVVPANTAYTERELEHIRNVTEPVLELRGDLTLPPHEPRDVEVDLASGSDIAMLGFTSGTTGQPKAAMLTHDNLIAGARSVIESWQWTSQDRLLLSLPLFHMHGLGVGVNGSLMAGSSIVVVPKFSPTAIVEAIERYEPTMFFGVPTMYAKLRDAGALAALARLRLCVSGSAPLAPSLFADIERTVGQPPLERYGMTETVMLAGNPIAGPRKAGSVGQPLPGVEIRLDEATGEVQVAGPNVFSGYLNQPEQTAAAFTDDGYFRTGDIGRFDEDGFLSLVGRASELIITGGYNVYPREVEDAMRQCPGVKDAAVVGKLDDVWGEVVVGFIVGEVEEEKLTEHAARVLADYKRPRMWMIVSDLPRNAMGKVDRLELANRVS